MCTVLVVGELRERNLTPEVRREERVCFRDGCEGSLQEVTHRGRRTLGLRVAILDTRELEQTLRRRRRNESGTSGSGYETAHDGTDLSRDLRGYSVGLTEVGTPVTPTDRNDGELSEDDGATDGSRDFLGALNTETDVAVEVADRNERLEARALTSTGLLLDGHDLHDLIFELGEEEIDDLVLLDGKREEVDLLHGLDLAVLHETAELGDGDPLLLLVPATTTAGTATAPSTVTTPTPETAASASRVSHSVVAEK